MKVDFKTQFKTPPIGSTVVIRHEAIYSNRGPHYRPSPDVTHTHLISPQSARYHQGPPNAVEIQLEQPQHPRETFESNKLAVLRVDA